MCPSDLWRAKPKDSLVTNLESYHVMNEEIKDLIRMSYSPNDKKQMS